MEDVGPGEQEPPAGTFGVASGHDLLGPLSNLIRRNYAKSTKKRTFEKVSPGKNTGGLAGLLIRGQPAGTNSLPYLACL